MQVDHILAVLDGSYYPSLAWQNQNNLDPHSYSTPPLSPWTVC